MKKSSSERFSAAMKWAIDHHGIVQNDFANKCGVSPATITDYKYGRRTGNEDTRETMAKNLGYDYRDFLALGQWILDGNDGKDWKKETVEVSSRPIGDRGVVLFAGNVHIKNKAAVEIAEWIEQESGLIDYGEAVKSIIAEEYPRFIDFLKKRAEGGGPGTAPQCQDRKAANGEG